MSGRTLTVADCRDPGFTPGARDVPTLLQLWANTRRAFGRAHTKPIVQALARGDQGVADALVRDFSSAPPEERALRLRVLARLAQRIDRPLEDLFGQALADPEPVVVREAARGLAKLDDVDALRYEDQLMSIARHADLPERRAAVEALGRIGRPQLLPKLRALPCNDDDLARRTADAMALLTRRGQRDDRATIRTDVRLPNRLPIRLRCRGGAEAAVCDELQLGHPTNPTIDARGVLIHGTPTLDELYRGRCLTELGLVFSLPERSDLVERVVAGLRQPALLRALQAWTSGTPRFRIEFASPGRHRGALWAVVRRLAQLDLPLINDTRDVTWTIEIDTHRDEMLCLPRGGDHRFAYRLTDVPAATHPTIAALMIAAGSPQPGELVWDPFCGSGTELIEAALASDRLRLWGTDIDEQALARARTNLEHARVKPTDLTLEHGDALRSGPPGDVSLIVSNPPMGRRVMVGERRVRELLEQFVLRATAMLAPGGRMVLLSPMPGATAIAGRRAGLDVLDLAAIEMGGFFATPQLLRKR